jgi:excinuclease ABC subunit C
MAVIEGKRRSVEKEIERDMNSLAKASEFEKAAKARNQLFALQNLTRQVIFSDKEFQDISKDHALNELVNLLSLSAVPRRIEGFDISHMQGTDVVASMVVFTNGVSNKGEYRKFKTKKDHNNDFYNMSETISRRFNLSARGQAPSRNAWKGSLPGLVLIDGGKGQLDAAIRARDEAGQSTIPFVGLAKREEQIVIKKSQESRVKRQEKQQSSSVIPVKTGIQSNSESPEAMLNPTGSRVKPGMTKGGSNVFLNVDELHRLGGFVQESEDFILVSLPHSTNLVKLLQRIRDESHRFAVSYHSVLKVKRQSASLLDDIPTIGPATRKKLIRTFGSMRGVMQARDFELDQVLGAKKATILRQYLRPLRRDQQDQAELQ